MNITEFHTLSRALEADLKATAAINQLTSLIAALERLVANPADSQSQQQVSEAREAIQSSLKAAPSADFTPRWLALIEDELHTADLLARPLDNRIESVFAQNQITPQTALDSLREIHSRLEQYQTALVNVNSALDFFDVGTEDLAPGEYEAALEIPRGEVDNDLAELGEEFIELSKIILPFVEAATGSRPPVKVKSIASSDFEAFVELVPQAAALLSIAVDRVLVAYEKVLNIRKLRAEMKESGVEDEDLVAIDQRATSLVTNEIPAIVAEVMQAAPEIADAGRRNEIEVELRRSVRSIARKVDHGFRITVRTEPLPEPEVEGDEDEYPPDPTPLEEINRQVLSNQVRAKFQELPGEPILELDGPTSGEDGPATPEEPDDS